MSANEKKFNTLNDALHAAAEWIGSGKFDLDKRKFLIVPDRITLTAERELCGILGGIMNIEICTFTSLIRRYIVSPAESLSQQGSVMLIKRILEEKQGELQCYKKSCLTKGFAGRLYATISELAFAGIGPEDVSLSKGKAKAEDIKLVYSEYLERVNSLGLPDACARMIRLEKYVRSSGLFKGADVAFACFGDMTRQMMRIKKAIEETALASMTFSAEPCTGVRKESEVKITESDSQVSSAKSMASEIVYLVNREKASPDDICVLTSSDNPAEIRRIFSENGIPFSAPSPLKLSQHPLGGFIKLALSVPEKGYKAEDVINLSKSIYTGLTREEMSCFERYTQKFGVGYKGFFSSFDKESVFTDKAERGRAKLEKILNLKADDITERLEKLIGIAEQAEKDNTADEGRANPFDRLKEISGLASRILKGAAPKVAADAVIDAMDSAELNCRPKTKNAVTVGTEEDLKSGKYKYVFVADFSGDNHPKIVHDDGLLNDDDMDELQSKEKYISSSVDINRRNKSDFYYILFPAEKIYLYYSETVARICGEIKNRAGKVREEKLLNLNAQPLTKERIEKNYNTLNLLLEKYLSGSGEGQLGKAVYETVKCKIPEKIIIKDVIDCLPSDMIEDHISPVLLECYYQCPRKYFFQNVLKLLRNEEAKIDAISVGNIIHHVAENYVKKAINNAEFPEPQDVISGLLDDAILEYKKELKPHEKEIIMTEALNLCREIKHQSDIGKFFPAGAEVKFGFDDGLPGITVHAGGRDITLLGAVDRIDVAKEGDKTFARVMDYKSGSVEFNPGKIEKGIKLQLPMYLKIAKDYFGQPVAGLYMPTLKEKGEYKLLGMLDLSPESLESMGGLIDVKYAKNGNPSVKAPVYACSDGRMDKITGYSMEMAKGAAEEIMAGFIKPFPYKKGICKYCEYRAACEKNGGEEEDEEDA